MVAQKKPGFGKTLRIACLLTLLASGLAGCDLLPATPEPSPPTPEPVVTPSPQPTDALPPGVTQLVFWEPFALDRPQGLLLGEMIRDFEAENPDIQIEIVPKSGYVGIDGAMQAALLDGEQAELPDLAVAFPSMIAEYAAAGIVAPLDPYLYDPEVGLTGEELADFQPGFLEAGRLPGQAGSSWPSLLPRTRSACGSTKRFWPRQAGTTRLPPGPSSSRPALT